MIDTLIEVLLKDDGDFLKIKETLTRIGVASEKSKTLYQSCHILHKKGKYYIVHFKELFSLDGKPSNFDQEDRARRNRIANLLEEWNLLDLKDPQKSKDPVAPINQVKIISYKDKDVWNLVAKYNIGKKI